MMMLTRMLKKKMREKMEKKWHSSAGETLPELLLAVFVFSMAFLLFASAMILTARLQERAENDFEAYYAGRNDLYSGKKKQEGCLILEEHGIRKNLSAPSESAHVGIYPISFYSGTGIFSEIYRYEKGEYNDTD